MFCTKCNINWASLAREDDEAGDESYEYCPKCKSDMFLEEARPGDKFLYMFGQVLNVKTKQRVFKPSVVRAYIPPVPFDTAAWQQQKKDQEQLVEKALDAYTDAYSKVGQVAAEQAYRNVLRGTLDQPVEVPEIKLIKIVK